MKFKNRVTWFDRIVKDRIELLKKIAIYGTLVLWAGIWLATRGEEKPSLSVLFEDISNSWTKQQSQTSPAEK